MTGLIASQIHITGDLEKDQQLLIYGIGGLIGLIVLAMIIIVVVVVIRRGRASRVVENPAPEFMPPTAEAYQPAEPEVVQALQSKPIISIEETPETEVTPEPAEKPKPEQPPIVPVEEPTPVPIPVQDETASPKYDFGAYKEELAHQNPNDKMKEIRDRLEEIKRQRQAEPAPVKPETEVKSSTYDIVPATEAEHDPIVPEEEILAEEEMDETRPINEVPDPEAVSILEVPQVERLEPKEETAAVEEKEAEVSVPEEVPTPAELEVPVNEPTTGEVSVNEAATGEETGTVTEEPVHEEPTLSPDEIHIGSDTYYTTPNEPVMELQREPAEEPESPAKEAAKTETALHPNGKFLPMKKLTFAEWVELFK